MAVAAAWELASLSVDTPLMPDLGNVALGLRDVLFMDGGMGDVRDSVTRVAVGLTAASVVGTLLGIAMAQSRPLLLLLTPALDLARSTSGLAIYPLVIVFLGLGESSKFFLVFWGAWPPVLLNTLLGLGSVDPSVLEAARLDGAGRLRLLRYVSLPLATPAILTGIRIGAGIGWIGLVAAEMIVGSSGLGYLILINSQIFHYPEAYAAVVLVSLCGFATHHTLLCCQRAIERMVLP